MTSLLGLHESMFSYRLMTLTTSMQLQIASGDEQIPSRAGCSLCRCAVKSQRQQPQRQHIGQRALQSASVQYVDEPGMNSTPAGDDDGLPLSSSISTPLAERRAAL